MYFESLYMYMIKLNNLFAGLPEDTDQQKFVPPPSQPVFPGQLSPSITAPQFDISGFDTSQLEMSNESPVLGKSAEKSFDSSDDNLVESTGEINKTADTIDKMSSPFFPGQDSAPAFKSQYARTEALFKLGRPPGLYFCKFCGKVMQNKSVFEYHVRTHTGEKPFKCEVCHRHFAGRQPLETHKRLHTGERPFSCDICHRSFTARSGRDYHRRKHHINMINEFVATSQP